MADMRNAFIAEEEATKLNKHKRDTDIDLRPDETPSQWIRRIKKANRD